MLWFELDLVIVQQFTGVYNLSVGHLLELSLADQVVQDLGLCTTILELSMLLVELLLQLPDLFVLPLVRLMLELGLFTLLLYLSLRSTALGAKLE